MPVWVQWVSTFAMPIIALVGIFIALQQWRVARHKVKMDLYDKRYEVYLAAKNFVVDLHSNPPVDIAAIIKFGRDTDQARYLFKCEVIEYLDALQKKAWALRKVQQRLNVADEGGKAALFESEDDLYLWLSGQLKSVAFYFDPYLSLHDE